MRKILIALAVVVLATSAASASEKTDVMAPVNQFVDGFNKGDMASALAACADQTSIVDDFAPHQWQGTGACAAWAKDFDAEVKKDGMSNGVVTLGKPRHVDITGDVAYVVVPASYTYKEHGKMVNESGSTFTVVLRKGGAGWRIIAWTWSKG